MNTENIENTEMSNTETSVETKKKKKFPLFLLFLLIFILLIGGGFAYYYFSERNQAQKAVEAFLSNAQKMDFASMEKYLQNSDLSSLDEVDLRNPTYTEFFQDINKNMSFKITQNDFDLQNGTAKITAHIKYVDGSAIYQDAIGEFLRQMVSSALSEQTITPEETHQKLASILTEKASQMEYSFTESDVVYPVIKIKDQWKIASLDENTVKIMSANFQSVIKDLESSLSSPEIKEENTVDSIPSPSKEDTINMTTDKFTIHYTQHKIEKDFSGEPCLLLYYDYTNNSNVASSAMVDVNIQAYQNGKVCNAAIPEKNNAAIDNFMKEVGPGETVNVCQVFTISGKEDVTLQASETFRFNNGKTASQILKIQ